MRLLLARNHHLPYRIMMKKEGRRKRIRSSKHKASSAAASTWSRNNSKMLIIKPTKKETWVKMMQKVWLKTKKKRSLFIATAQKSDSNVIKCSALVVWSILSILQPFKNRYKKQRWRKSHLEGSFSFRGPCFCWHYYNNLRVIKPMKTDSNPEELHYIEYSKGHITSCNLYNSCHSNQPITITTM